MTITPSRRLQAHRAYGRAVDAFEPIAWRPPSPARFDGRAANDAAPERESDFSGVVGGVPGWLVIVLGGLVAAVTGGLLGGMLQL